MCNAVMKSLNYIENENKLEKINAPLIHNDHDTSGKIGIFLPGGNGDIMTAMSVLKYKDIVFPNKKIIWFCNMPCADAFKFGPISEVRTYEWESLEVDPYTQLRTENSRLNQEIKYAF